MFNREAMSKSITSETKNPLQPVKILFVDDDEAIRQIYSMTLKANNRVIDFAADGEEGLKKLTENKYDLVITGIIMPKMDGLEMLEKMRKAGIKQHKVIILTNHNLRLSEDKLKDLGVDGYYLKSDVTPDKLAEIVNTKLEPA